MAKYTTTFHGPLSLQGRVRLTPGQEHLIRLSGGTPPTYVPVRLVIDTGSGRSTLLPSIIAHLKPVSRSRARIETSLGSGDTELFWVRLEFPDTRLAAVSELVVARLTMPPSLATFQGVIGRDLLDRWEYFRYEGRRGRFSIRDVPRSLFDWFWD